MRRFCFLLIFLFGALVARSEYLYWQINYDTADESGEIPVYTKNGFSFTMAHIVAFNDDNALVLGNDEFPTEETPPVNSADLSSLTDVSTYSFYIELMRYNETSDVWEVAALSDIQTYSALKNLNYIDREDEPSIPSLVWHGTSYMVPEPSGGLLVLIGTGLLALRRRKSKEC